MAKFVCIECGESIEVTSEESYNKELHCEHCDSQFSLEDVAYGSFYEGFEDRMEAVENFLKVMID